MVKEKLHYNDDDAKIGRETSYFPCVVCVAVCVMFRLGEEHNFPVLILTAIFYPDFFYLSLDFSVK